MFPVSTLPVSPLVGPTGMGTLLGVVALGALVALLVGLMVHRREQQRMTAIALPESGEAGAEPAKPRLSA